MNFPLPLAELGWTEGGQPVSMQFGDIYPSRARGLEESSQRYLLPNRLEQRWASLTGRAHFCIGETGFGVGLNFLTAWQLWERTAPTGARLHFVSAEKFPLAAADLRHAHALWPELTHWSGQLLEQYSSPAPGWQHYVFDNGTVTLTLLVGDALELFEQLDATVDAWFLDGVDPQKDPGMWQPGLYRQMARLAHVDTTLSSFTTADAICQGLRAAGFTVQTLKREEHTAAILTGQASALPADDWTPPWYSSPSPMPGQSRQAMIIGAGLSGCCTARALAQRGWQVTVIERHASEAREASGNPQGILYCKLSPHQTPLSRFVQSSYTYSLRLLQRLLPQDDIGWSACGVVQLSGSEKEAARMHALAAQGYPPNFLQGVSSHQASTIAGIRVDQGGLYFPEGGWVSPPAFCRALLDHPAITLLTCSEAVDLHYREGLWHARDTQEKSHCAAPVAIICGAGDSRRFSQTAHLPLKTIRGQITRLPATAQSRALRSVLCGEGYISPARGGEHFVGASFRFDRSDTEPSAEENSGNLAMLASLSPALDAALRSGGELDPGALQARAAMRCTSPDYLPLIGPVADAGQFQQDYAVLAKDASKRPDKAAPWQPGLFVNVAHGSRGLISCPLSGELIAAMLEGEPLPLPRDLIQAVHPSRFLLRQLVRGT